MYTFSTDFLERTVVYEEASIVAEFIIKNVSSVHNNVFAIYLVPISKNSVRPSIY